MKKIKLLPLGYYKNFPVYYDLISESLLVSSGREIPKISPSLHLGVTLLFVPLMQLLDGVILKGGFLNRIFILIVVMLFLKQKVYKFNENQYQNIDFKKLELSKDSVEEFLEEQSRGVKIVQSLIISVIFLMILFFILYFYNGNFFYLVLFACLYFILLLLISNQLHKRKRIYKKLEEELKND
ncbi:hypothetical protein [Streptococcus suis]|uniref:hypothetical protein n=2 Tax=Streptococcus suis TaxID=1307 RepID=UPI000CF368EB|nr:hypothetical protein [Streptococcus suis]